MDNAFNYIYKNGIQTSESYPYVAREQSCRADSSKFVTSIKDWIDIPQNNGQYLEDCAAKTTIAGAVDATGFWTYTGGVVTRQECGTQNVNHGVAIVGYGKDRETGLDYWIIRNCWGTDWGMDGYMWIEKDVNREGAGACTIRQKVSFAYLGDTE